MKPETILSALTDIDDTFLAEIPEPVSQPCLRRRAAVVLAAVIALLAITACAVVETDGWLESFFSTHSGTALSIPQLAYLQTNGQNVHQSRTCGGYTVTLESYIGTTDTVYVVFRITAPGNTDISTEDFRIRMDARFTGVYGREPGAITTGRLDDGDGRSNTLYYICILEHREYVYHDVPEWKVCIDNLFRVAYDPSTGSHTYPILAEGPWEFTIDLTKSDTTAVELLTEPIQTLAIIPSEADDSTTVGTVTVTSVVLSPLDILITYQPVNACNASFEGFVGDSAIALHPCVVMKDGSIINLRYGMPFRHGDAKLLADTPIVPADADYLLLPDGTRLAIP